MHLRCQVRLFDFFEDDDFFYLVMEHCVGTAPDPLSHLCLPCTVASSLRCIIRSAWPDALRFLTLRRARPSTYLGHAHNKLSRNPGACGLSSDGSTAAAQLDEKIARARSAAAGSGLGERQCRTLLKVRRGESSRIVRAVGGPCGLVSTVPVGSTGSAVKRERE